MRKLLAIAVAAALASCSTGSTVSDARAKPIQPAKADPNNPWRAGRTLVIPHGGGDGLYPEDTMLAFEKTMAMGGDVVDVDLRLSSDKVVMGIHNQVVDGITNGHGKVGDFTATQLQSFDAGWGFARGSDHPFRGQGIKIPTLEEILNKFPGRLLSLDIKDDGMEMVTPLCTLLRQYHRTIDVFVGSDFDAQILAFRKQCPDVRTSATMVDVYASRAAKATHDPNFKPVPLVDQPPYKGSNGQIIVTPDSLAFAHAHGVAILTWVVNDEKDMRHLIEIGVDGIYTSRPDLLLKVLHG